jgi:hypothetical protein
MSSEVREEEGFEYASAILELQIPLVCSSKAICCEWRALGWYYTTSDGGKGNLAIGDLRRSPDRSYGTPCNVQAIDLPLPGRLKRQISRGGSWLFTNGGMLFSLYGTCEALYFV